MGIIKTIVYALAALMAITFLSAIVGAFVFGMGAGISERADSQTTPNDLNVKERITLSYDGRNETVDCQDLTVTGNSNIIIFVNDDIERITITGDWNCIAYQDTANPEIIDKGNNNVLYSVPITIATPVVTATPEIDPDVKESITLIYDGREEHIKCNRLLVTGNANTVIIENDDIEKITILGDGNSVAYPNEANPEVFDRGNYNNVWGSIWI